MRNSIEEKAHKSADSSERTSSNTITSRLFRDKTGSYVIGQPPNIPIILVAIGVIGSHLFVQGSTLAQAFSLLGFGAVFLWAYLEIMYGESLFRRILGAVVLIGVFVITLR